MTESYSDFAKIYDELMIDIPYDRYVEIIQLAANGLNGKKVLDIGCGTGILSVKLGEAGAIVTGVDLSQDMLTIAKERAQSLSLPIEFVHQPMEQLNGFTQYDIAVIAIDSLNYLRNEKEVMATFRHIHNALGQDGLLLFDVHSTYKMDEIFMEGPFTFDNGKIAYIWDVEAGEEMHSVQSELTFFVQNVDGLYTRFDEIHRQRTFPLNDYINMLRDCGFTIERVFADWEDEPPHEESERIFFQVRK